MSDFIQIGKILKTKGFDGTLIIAFDFALIKSGFKAVFIQKNAQYIPLLIENFTLIDEQTSQIKFANYSSKELAQSLHNREIYLSEETLDTYFDIDVDEDFIGYGFYNFEKKIGEVIDLMEGNIQEILEVKLENGKTVLLPFVDEYILTIDDDKKAIYSELSEDYLTLFSN